MGNSKLIQTIGQRIRNYRVQQGLSQERLAELAGVHPTYIGQIERGEKNLTIESLEKITCALNVPLSRMTEKAEDAKREQNFPLAAYELILARSPREQEKLLRLLTDIVQFKEE